MTAAPANGHREGFLGMLVTDNADLRVPLPRPGRVGEPTPRQAEHRKLRAPATFEEGSQRDANTLVQMPHLLIF